MLEEGSMLDAILSDCQRMNKSYEIEFGDIPEYRIVKKGYSTIEIVQEWDTYVYMQLETSYRPNESVEFYDVSK